MTNPSQGEICGRALCSLFIWGTPEDWDRYQPRRNYVLDGYSLIGQSAAGVHQMHSLVQFCTRAWLEDFGEPKRWSSLFLSLASEHFPGGDFETWATCRMLLPHVEGIAAGSVATTQTELENHVVMKNCWCDSELFVAARDLSSSAGRSPCRLPGLSRFPSFL